MIPPHLTYLIIIFSIFQLPQAVHGFRNITVDSQNPAIVYSPQAGWSNVTIGDVNPGRVCMVTTTPNGTATFSFTGLLAVIISQVGLLILLFRRCYLLFSASLAVRTLFWPDA